MDQMSLDNILEEKPPVEAPKEEPVKVESDNANIRHQEKEEAAQGRVRDGTGKFVKKEEVKEEKVEEKPKETPKEAPKQEFSDKEKALLAALQDERRKRQDLERKAQEVPVKKPDKPFWEAPEEHFKSQEELHKAWEQKQTERETVMTLRVAEMMARKEHPDFDEKVTYFGEMVAKIPGLYQQWLQSPDPGEFAYKTAKDHKELQEVGSRDKLVEKLEKEIRIKLESELKEKEKKLREEREAIPSTLSDVRGKNQQKTVWGGPPDLNDILKRDDA
jgi:hypothetical protein